MRYTIDAALTLATRETARKEVWTSEQYAEEFQKQLKLLGWELKEISNDS